MKTLRPADWLFAILLMGTWLPAQQPSTDQIRKMSLEDLMQTKITTASKAEQRVWEAPASVMVMSRETIERRGYSDLLDVLRDVPYFQIQSQHGHWTKGAIVNLRGHRSGDSGNNKFLVLVDGIRLSDDAEEGLYLGLHSIPLSAVEQIEVVYGPNSTLYGRDAYAGMINLITRKKNYTSAGLSYGTYNTRTAHAGFLRWLRPHVAAHLNVSSYRSNEQDPTGESVSYRQRHVFPRHPYTERFYRASDNLALDAGLVCKGLNVRYIRYDIEGSETYGGNPDLYVTEYSTVASQHNQIFFIDYRHKFRKNIELQLYAAAKNYEFDPRTANLYVGDLKKPAPGFGFDPGASDSLFAYGGRKYYYFRTRSAKHGFKITSRLTSQLSNVSGWEIIKAQGIPVISEGKGGKPISTDRQREALEHDFRTGGLYSEFTFRTRDDLLFTFGGRADFHSMYSSTFMPRAAVVYHRNGHVLKLLYASGYLAPSISQIYFESLTTFSWIQTNPALEPERNTSIELDWNWTLNRARYSANFFFNRLKDGIVESVTTGDSATIKIDNQSYLVPILQSRNASSGFRCGINLSANYRLFNWLNLSGQYTYLVGEDEIFDKEISLQDNLVPQHTLQGVFSYRHPRFILTVNMFWQSRRRILSPHSETAYSNLTNKEGYIHFGPDYLTDLIVKVPGVYDNLTFYLNVKNLFNRKYYGQTISAAWGSPKILQDLRRITVGFEYEM